MRPSLLFGIVQLKPRVLERLLAVHRRHYELCDGTLGAREPSILDRDIAGLRERHLSYVVDDRGRVIPSILVLIHGGCDAVNQEIVRVYTREGAWRVLGWIGVDMEIDAARGGGGDVAADIERNFCPDIVADFARRLGAEVLVGLAFLNGDDEVGKVNELEVSDYAESEEQGGEGKEAHDDDLRGRVLDGVGEICAEYLIVEASLRPSWCNRNEAVKAQTNMVNGLALQRYLCDFGSRQPGCRYWLCTNIIH
jgi:hypothetical protein